MFESDQIFVSMCVVVADQVMRRHESVWLDLRGRPQTASQGDMTQGNIVDWFYRWVRGFVTGYFVCNLAEPQLRGQAPNSHHTWQNFQALLKIVARVVLI